MLAKRLTTSEEVHKAEVLSKAVAICTVPNVEESVSGKVPIATSSSKEQNDWKSIASYAAAGKDLVRVFNQVACCTIVPSSVHALAIAVRQKQGVCSIVLCTEKIADSVDKGH